MHLHTGVEQYLLEYGARQGRHGAPGTWQGWGKMAEGMNEEIKNGGGGRGGRKNDGRAHVY